MFKIHSVYAGGFNHILFSKGEIRLKSGSNQSTSERLQTSVAISITCPHITHGYAHWPCDHTIMERVTQNMDIIAESFCTKKWERLDATVAQTKKVT